MTGVALLFACFWQMLKTSRPCRVPDDVHAALSPTAWELADLLFNTKTGELWAGLGYILKGFAALFFGIVHGVKRLLKEPDPLRFSHYKVPVYWQPNDEEERPMRESVEDFEVRSGGFPVGFGANGLEYSDGETRAGVRAVKEAERVKLSESEREKMLANDPPLRNMALAEKIKNYLLDGKSDYEAAMLSGCSESYVKKHRLCFELPQTTTLLVE